MLNGKKNGDSVVKMGSVVKTRFEIAAPVVEAEMAKPYQYGVADCFFLGCRVADAFDPSREMVKTYADAYRTFKGAQRAMWKRGYTSIVDLLDVHLERCAPSLARDGDLAVLLLSDGEHVGVSIGGRFVTKTARGRSRHGVGDVKAAFRT